jgi:hypothetical protein
MWNDKPDGYPIPDQNPTGTGMNFYPRVWVRVRVQISTHSLFAGGWVIALPEPDLLPSLLMYTVFSYISAQEVVSRT